MVRQAALAGLKTKVRVGKWKRQLTGNILKFEAKDDSSVIAITLSEKEAIREKFPRVHIVRTMKSDSKRHHYYMVEDGAPMRLLRSLRGQERPRDKRKGV